MAQSSSLFHEAKALDSLELRAQKQQKTYWRIRMAKALESLDKEARRMFTLEAELADFAAEYYRAVGEHAERLAALDSHLHEGVVSEVTSTTMEDVLATREMKQARAAEMKSRYRALAKEIHPDCGMAVRGVDDRAEKMQSLNKAYGERDLAALLRLEAEMLLTEQRPDLPALEERLLAVEKASATYAKGYQDLMNSSLHELMCRQFSARLAGWDWTQAVVRRVQRAIWEQERAIIQAKIAAIGDWRYHMRQVA